MARSAEHTASVPPARRSSRGLLFACGALLVAALLARSQPALAYCQTSLCANGMSGTRCSPAQAGDCGTALRWPGGCMGYSLHEGASKQVDYATLANVMERAFSAWSKADCGAGSRPGIRAVDLGPIACDQKEYNLQAGNANAVFFHDDAWPYAGAGNTLALTTVTFNLDDGSILDADLEINGTVDLTTGDEGVQFDLQSIVTHEAGHMLGIAHSADKAATMFILYEPGDTSLRTLDEDDVGAICATYPSADVSTCDPSPRRGLATECDPPPLPEEEPGCTCGTTPRRAGADGWLCLAPGLALAAARRRARPWPSRSAR